MNLKHALFLLGAAAVLTALVVFMFYSYERHVTPPNTRTLPYMFSVAEVAGVDVGTDLFRLGAVPPGSAAHRTLHVSDPFDFESGEPRMVRITAKGQGSEWLVIEPSEALLPLDAKITVRVPDDAPLGTYEGLLYVTTLPTE